MTAKEIAAQDGQESWEESAVPKSSGAEDNWAFSQGLDECQEEREADWAH